MTLPLVVSRWGLGRRGRASRSTSLLDPGAGEGFLGGGAGGGAAGLATALCTRGGGGGALALWARVDGEVDAGLRGACCGACGGHCCLCALMSVTR